MRRACMLFFDDGTAVPSEVGGRAKGRKRSLPTELHTLPPYSVEKTAPYSASLGQHRFPFPAGGILPDARGHGAFRGKAPLSQNGAGDVAPAI